METGKVDLVIVMGAHPALLGIPKPSDDRTWAKVEHSAESIITALGKESDSEERN